MKYHTSHLQNILKKILKVLGSNGNKKFPVPYIKCSFIYPYWMKSEYLEDLLSGRKDKWWIVPKGSFFNTANKIKEVLVSSLIVLFHCYELTKPLLIDISNILNNKVRSSSTTKNTSENKLSIEMWLCDLCFGSAVVPWDFSLPCLAIE